MRRGAEQGGQGNAAPTEARSYVLPAAGLFAAALALRLLLRNPENVWLDEANTVLIASRSWGEILQALRRDGNPPLYYFLLHLWMQVAGDGEGALRFLSALLGATLAPALYLAARAFRGRTAGMAAGLLALAWPLHIYYSGQIRMYSLLPTLSLAFMAAVLSTRRRPTWPRWALVALSALALIWTHNYGLFVVAALPFVWASQGPRTRGAALQLCATLAVIFLADLLWLPVVLRQAATEVGSWIAREFTPSAPLHTLLLFGSGSRYPHYLQTLGGKVAGAPLAVLWVAAAAVGVFRARRSGTSITPLLLFLAVPLAIPYIASLLIHPVYLAGRYDTVAYPAFALLVGTAAQAAWESRNRAQRAAVAAFFLLYFLLGAITIHHYLNRPAERTEEKIALRLNDWLAPEDVLITTGLARAPVEYYLRRAGWSPGGSASGARPLRLESYPHETAEHLGWFDFATASRDGERMKREAEALVESLAEFRGTVFLLDHTGTAEMYRLNEPLRGLLARRSSARKILLRAGPDPAAGPVYEVSAFRMHP